MIRPLILALALVNSLNAFAQPLSFPTASGFGKHALGARGGTSPDVYIVDSLSDDGTQQGTLRHAIESIDGDQGRFIVFDVAGVILLEEGEPLKITNPYVTLAGQTAPQGGICIMGEGLFVMDHDIIIRGMRVRPSDIYSSQYGPTTERDAMKIGQGSASTPSIKNIIIDHCSFSWSMDEIVSAYSSCANVTYQYNIFSEALHDSLHKDEGDDPFENRPHSMGPTFGVNAENISLYRNIGAHNRGRNPMLKETDQIEVINNIFYNFGEQALFCTDNTGGQTLKANIVGNMWLAGPSVESPFNLKERLIRLSNVNANTGTQLYFDNNVAHYSSYHLKHDANPFAEGFYHLRSGAVVEEAVKSSPVFSGIPSDETTSLGEAENELDFLLETAGARWPLRDAIDARIANDVKNREGSIIDVVYQTPSEIPDKWRNPVGSRVAPDVDSDSDPKIPDYANLGFPSAADSDRDGIPDSLESKFGNDPLADEDNDGYLNIEEYINSIIDSPSLMEPTLSLDSPAIKQNGKLQLKLSGSPNSQYTLQTSPNLTDWDVLASIPTDSEGEASAEIVLDQDLVFLKADDQ